jgi:hypothetical protein
VDKSPEEIRTGHADGPDDSVPGGGDPGRQLFRRPDGTKRAKDQDRAVFVDASGLRSKKYRRVGWIVVTACSCYALTVLGVLIGGNSTVPWLPIPALTEKKSEPASTQPAPADRESAAPAPGLNPQDGVPPLTRSREATVAGPSDSGAAGDPARPDPVKSPSLTGPGASRGGETTAGPSPDASGGGPVEGTDVPTPGAPTKSPGQPGPDPSPSSDPLGGILGGIFGGQ